MDPLSISSGIAGLLSLAVSIAQVSFEYMSCVEDAPRTIKGLIKEITCLEEVLKGIRNELLLEPEIAQLRAQGMEDRWSGRDALLQECQKDLDALLQELKDKVKGKKVKLLDRASWYFKEDVMKDRIGMLCRYRDQFTALASQDILAIGTLTLKEVRDWRQEESNQKILRWLSPLDFAARHQDISSKRQPETLRWLLASPEYRTWSRSDIPGLIDNRVMWCYGNPGAGKTYASSRVLDHLLETPGMNKPGMAYVYCDYDDQNNQTLSNILGSILKQLIMQSATLPGFIDEIYRKDNHKPTNLEPEIFWKLLERLSKNFPRIYIILDALDELENDKLRTRRNLVRMISMSQAFENNVRIFATSRTHLEDINSALCVFPKLLIEARDSDMRSFLLQRIEGSEDLEDIIHNDEDFKAQIIKALIDKSNKLFLIPALHIDRLLESTSRAEIEETLENITGTIGDAYASTLSRIQNLPRARKELALDTLMWLSHSKRPLRFAELQEALAVRIGSKNINHKAYVSAKVVVNTCLGLIIIERESEIVRLMHPTLEEYLESSQDLFDDPIVKISRILLTYLRFPEPRKWLDDGCDRRYNLHTDGLEYFFNPEAVFPGKVRGVDTSKHFSPSGQPSLNGVFPFLNYSCMFWNRHTMVCQRELEPDILEYFGSRPYVVFSILSDGSERCLWVNFYQQFCQLRKSSLPRPSIELIYAVIHLFDDVVLRLIQRGVAFQAVYERQSLPTALSWLSLLCIDTMNRDRDHWNGCWIELNKFLQNVLKQGLTAKLDSSEQEILALLLPFVSLETMNIFLVCGFDVNCPMQPIHIAARFFTTTAIKFLGQCGADCNIKIGGSSPGDRPRRNPLEIMIKSGNVRELTDLSALEALLQAGSDARGSFDNKPLSTPLHMALSIVPFNEPLCELLAFHGAPISAVNGVGETPLRFWATRDTTSSWPPPPIDRDWLIGRWLKRHGASLSELEGAGCLRGKIPTVPCICRILMRVLVCPEDDKDKVLEAFHESRRRETEWHENPVFFFDWSNLYCHSLLLDWLK